MKDLSRLSLVELAALICESFKKEGITATLSGGACVEIYSCNNYVTGDLDFIINFVWPENQKKIEQIMSEFGFNKKGRVYLNESIDYSVEFPPGPLGIGEEYGIQPVEMKVKTGTLSLLSPTDSVKDRLTGYFYGNDNQCLEQAIMICKMNNVDLENIRNWAKREDRPEKFNKFERILSEWEESK